MSRKILYVEDEEDLRFMVGEYLKLSGHECWLAATAEEAVRVADQTPLDAIIPDLNLGGSSGENLIDVLHQKHPNAPILLYTGLEADDDMVKSRLARCSKARYVRKDGSLESLIQAIDSAVA